MKWVKYIYSNLKDSQKPRMLVSPWTIHTVEKTTGFYFYNEKSGKGFFLGFMSTLYHKEETGSLDSKRHFKDNISPFKVIKNID